MANSTLDVHLSKGMDLLVLGIENRAGEIESFASEFNLNDFYPHLVDALWKSVTAIINMDKNQMDTTVKSLKELIKIVDKLRNKSWTSWIIEPDYNLFTDEQCHAELVFADGQMASACNIVLADSTFSAFINAAICIRSAYSSYKTCLKILQSKDNWTSEFCRMHFESGTRTAMGSFDLMISFLPGKLIKLLEYTGFSGDRIEGLKQLELSLQIDTGSRWSVAALITGAHYTFFEYCYGLGEPDLSVVAEICHKSSLMFPNSSYFMTARGIYSTVIGNFDDALDLFGQSNNLCPQEKFKFANHMFSTLIHIFKNEWNLALDHANILQSCPWSPASFTYLRAVILYMISKLHHRPELMDQVFTLLQKVPSLKKNFGGQKAFHERFVLGRSKSFVENSNEDLELATFEFAYIGNFTCWIKGKNEYIDPIKDRIDCKLSLLTTNESFKCNDYYDKFAYLTFMSGVVDKLQGNLNEAKDKFKSVVEMENNVRNAQHAPAMASFELGMCYRAAKDAQRAKKWLKKSNTNYTGHFAEPMISFRAQLALDSLKKINGVNSQE